MQFYYGNQMPFRVLHKAEFWKVQEAEHTVVMRELMDNLEQEYVEALKRWEEALTKTHQQGKRYVETVIRSKNQLSPQAYQQVLELVTFCLQESVTFTEFCRQVKNESKVAQGNQTVRVVIDHIIDESNYFIGIAQNILYEQ